MDLEQTAIERLRMASDMSLRLYKLAYWLQCVQDEAL